MNDDFRFEQHPDGGYESDQLRDALDSLQGDLPIISSPPQARIYNNANISIANNTATVLTFNSERYDNGGLHSTSSNTGRLTVAVAGVYSIGGNVGFDTNATGVRNVALRVNGTTAIASDVRDAASSGVTTISMAGVEWRMAVGDYVEVVVLQTSGGALNVISSSAFSPEFWMTRLGSYGS